MRTPSLYVWCKDSYMYVFRVLSDYFLSVEYITKRLKKNNRFAIIKNIKLNFNENLMRDLSWAFFGFIDPSRYYQVLR